MEIIQTYDPRRASLPLVNSFPFLFKLALKGLSSHLYVVPPLKRGDACDRTRISFQHVSRGIESHMRDAIMILIFAYYNTEMKWTQTVLNHWPAGRGRKIKMSSSYERESVFVSIP
jgi:hypothetical protein